MLDEKELCKHYVFMFLSGKYSHDTELNGKKPHKIFVPVDVKILSSEGKKKKLLKLSPSKSHTTLF